MRFARPPCEEAKGASDNCLHARFFLKILQYLLRHEFSEGNRVNSQSHGDERTSESVCVATVNIKRKLLVNLYLFIASEDFGSLKIQLLIGRAVGLAFLFLEVHTTKVNLVEKLLVSGNEPMT